MIPWIQVYSNLPAHRKTCKLRDTLGLKSSYEAVGLIVCLWAWAAVNASDGNITGYSDRDIADAVCYRKQASKLMDAMVQSGFLDYTEDGRKVIHDWDVHARMLIDSIESSKQKNAERQKRYREKTKRKNNGTVTNENNGNSNVINNATHNESNAPTIPNLTIPNSIVSGNNTVSICVPDAEKVPAIKEGRSFTQFWEDYPNKADRDDAWEAWKNLNPDAETVLKIKSGLEAWKRSGQWLDDGPRYIPSAAKWLTKRRWECPPAPGKQPVPKGASGEMGEAEMEAIRRLMAHETEGDQ